MVKIKRLLILFIAIAFIAPPILSQTVQPGVVMEYRFGNKKKPLSGVEIEVKYAPSTKSGKDGTFLLTFNTLKPGDRVELTSHGIEKSGYEIFNKDAVDQWNISKKGKPFTVVMASSKRMKELRDDYSRHSSASYERQYQKDKKKLDDEQRIGKLKEQEYQKKLEDLTEWYEQQRGNINYYIDQFVRIDLNELSQEEAEIIKLVQLGRFEEAAKRYDALGIIDKFKNSSNDIKILMDDEGKIKDTRKQKENERDSLWISLQQQINFLEIAGGQENFDKISKLLKDAALADTTYLKSIYFYAKFLDDQRDYKEATRFYLLCLSLTSNDNFENRSVVMSRLGNSFLRIGDYNNSENYLLKTIGLLDQDTLMLAERKKELYRSAYNNIANLYNRKHANKDAEKYYYLALRYTVNPSDSINILYNLATMYNTQFGIDRSELAMGLLNKADSLLAQLQKESLSIEDISRQFNIKTQLITTYGNLKQYDRIDNSFNDALQLSEVLIQNNPQAYISQNLYLYNNYGAILIKQKRYEEAEVQFQKAYNLTKMFPGFEGKLLSLIVGGSLGNAQGFQIAKRERGKALLDSICPEFEMVHKSYPDVVTPYLSIFYKQNAYVYMLLENYDVALNYIDKAINLT